MYKKTLLQAQKPYMAQKGTKADSWEMGVFTCIFGRKEEDG